VPPLQCIHLRGILRVFFRVLLVGFGLFGPGAARAPEYICIIKLLYTASLPKLLAQFLATVNAAAGGQSQLLPICT